MILVLLLHIGLCDPRLPDCIKPTVANVASLPRLVHTSNGDFTLEKMDLWCPNVDKDCLYDVTYYEAHQIRIGNRQRDDEKDTVIHELFHAETGLKFEKKKMRGHDAIYELAHAMQRLLELNPELGAYLNGR